MPLEIQDHIEEREKIHTISQSSTPELIFVIMAYYDTQGQLILSDDCTMLQDMDNILVDSMWSSMLENSMPNMSNLDYPENNYTKNVPYTGVFRASDMNTVMPCSNGVQHVQSSPLSPPVTPETPHDEDDDCIESYNDCTSCVKCRQTASQKKAVRRQQNRESQRKFRARKEAKLSDAKARIRDLESLVMALEKTNIELRRRVEELGSTK